LDGGENIENLIKEEKSDELLIVFQSYAVIQKRKMEIILLSTPSTLIAMLRGLFNYFLTHNTKMYFLL
jgi:hypothetical protein